MQSKLLAKFLTITVLVFSLNVQAQHEEQEGTTGEKDVKTEIKESIDHHIQDAYDFTLFSDTKNNKHYGFPLPVILIDEGLHRVVTRFASTLEQAMALGRGTDPWDTQPFTWKR